MSVDPHQSTEAPAEAPKVNVTAASSGSPLVPVSRIVGYLMTAWVGVFLINNFLNFWFDWPSVPVLFAHLGLFGTEALSKPLDAGAAGLAWTQFGLYAGSLAVVVLLVLRTPDRCMHDDADTLSDLTAYFIRGCFWAVLLIGVVDMVISFLRVEDMLVGTVGKQMASDLGRSKFRGEMVHYPLIALSFVIAYFRKSIGFTWLALLIVIAEIQIVIARFVFSYEQAFMADLVRFWYGALFLFASPYTLVQEGHVRVDILYAGFTERGKAWTNMLGSLLLGIPLCWVILTQGMWGKFSVINGPLLTFEVTQAGYGLYVKYWLAAFLLVFGVAMMVQFASYFLSSVAVLMREPGYHPDMTEHANV
ncbi:MAG: TRAP transporter small permease subunit [Magnetovibrio sp.]|nr:TRAP transporter small permease subunit [Magnetovibrio sp.]